MERNDDILAHFDVADTNEDTQASNTIFQTQEDTSTESVEDQILEIHEEVHEDSQWESSHIVEEAVEVIQTTKVHETTTQEKTPSVMKRILSPFVFFIKYITTSALIFWVLLVVANYSAYMNLAYSFLYAEEMERTKNSLIESVAAASIEEKEETEEIVDTFRELKANDDTKVEKSPSMHSLSQIANHNNQDIDLSIDITPYENRIIIPKIGKNIPLIDIKQKKVDGIDELNDIFMDELENGVIRYPGSGIPGENGNSFIFGHSSNFPWMEGDYNDVFALLDHVEFDDEVVVYYGQEKHTYKIRTKNVISPGDVSVLKSDVNADRSQVTLMTCWPIGTTLNRLVLTGDLISVEK